MVSRTLSALTFISVVSSANVGTALADTPAEKPPVRIGWIGAMTGPVAKYGAVEAATLALEDINREGGIGGRPAQLIFEDGKCQAKEALQAANALIEKEKVHFIVGGHCSTESLVIAPLVERSGALMLAAISSSPKLSTAGDHVFRCTAPNTVGVDLLVPALLESGKMHSIAVVYEETEYAQGMAEFFEKRLTAKGGKVPVSLAFKIGDGDFLSFATRIKSSGADGLYLSVQSADAAILLLSKLKQLGVNIPLFGNEIAGNALLSASAEQAPLFEGLLFAEPYLDEASGRTQEFVKRYRERFHVDKIPNGFWTMEAYDAVRVLANTIALCGEDVQKVKECLYALPSYQGVSGELSFDTNGDGVRNYVVKVVEGGKIHQR